MVDYSPEIEELLSLSEKELQAQIIEPLLRELGFTKVFDNSGPGEKGKDLVATKLGEFGRTRLYSIQIKRFKPSAKAGSKASFGLLLDQLRQSLQEPVRDPSTNTSRPPDACIFITPYPIPARAQESFFERMHEPIFRGLELIDGPLLIDLIRRHVPEALSTFSVETQYRLRIDHQAGVITESPAAFGLATPLELETIYVDVSVGQRAHTLQALAASGSVPVVRATIAEVKEFCLLVREWAKKSLPELERCLKAAEKRLLSKITEAEKLARLERRRAPQAYDEDMAAYRKAMAEYRNRRRLLRVPVQRRRSTIDKGIMLPKRPPRDLEERLALIDQRLQAKKHALTRCTTIPIKFDPLIDPMRSQARNYLRDLDELSAGHANSERCTAIARAGIVLHERVGRLVESGLVQKYWNPDQTAFEGSAFIRVSSSVLARIRTHIYVLGAPGSGKTTMLRRFTQYVARNAGDDLPIFMPLTRFEHPLDDVIRACAGLLIAHGYKRSIEEAREELTTLLTRGKLRLFLDGLDETGDRAEETMAAVAQLAARYPACQMVVSTRDTFRFPKWRDAFVVRLEPFTDAQLSEFVERWFAAQPSAKAGLMSWLSKNQPMMETARTPLMADLLCSLYESHADMPLTEVELYSSRFELLLGKWERAKGILALPLELRERYRRFLMAFAMQSHCGVRRFRTVEEAAQIANHHYDPIVHRGPEALVEDCVRRGLLFREATGGLSFGHLTYQEFLAAEWLSENRSVKFVWSRLLTPWWNKTLEFYAAKRMDIDQLLREALKYKGETASMERLLDLAKLAPLTSRTLIERLRRHPRSAELVAYDWGRRPLLPEFG